MTRLSCARPEQACRAHQQHHDEHDEDADLAELFPEIKAAQAFHDPDKDAGDQGTRHRTHAAEDDNGESNQHEGVSCVRVDVVGRNSADKAGDGKTGRADPECDRVDVRHFDAGELGAELLLGDGADGLAGIRQPHAEP